MAGRSRRIVARSVRPPDPAPSGRGRSGAPFPPTTRTPRRKETTVLRCAPGGRIVTFDPTSREPSSPRHASLAKPLERTPRLNPTHADFQSVPASVPPTFAVTRGPTAAAPARAAGASPATRPRPPGVQRRRAGWSPSPRRLTTRCPSTTTRRPRLRRRRRSRR